MNHEIDPEPVEALVEEIESVIDGELDPDSVSRSDQVESAGTSSDLSNHEGLAIPKLFSDVSVRLSVELGRTRMPLSELMQLKPGSIVDLDRNVSDPVEILAHGVCLARGELVVTDDQFAIRILELCQTAKK